MNKLSMLIDRHGVDVLEHLDRDALVPALAGLQAQGDVIVVPAPMVGGRLTEPCGAVPADGVVVVRGENGGNTHLLLAEGDVRYDPDSGGGLRLGALRVPVGAVAYLAHPEHGYLGIAPGAYEIRRQREQADELRLVAD